MTYQLEYGTDQLEIHQDAVQKGQRVLICDDLLATGGTAAAAITLVRQLGGDVVGAVFAVELSFLNGRSKLPGVDVFSPLKYVQLELELHSPQAKPPGVSRFPQVRAGRTHDRN